MEELKPIDLERSRIHFVDKGAAIKAVNSMVKSNPGYRDDTTSVLRVYAL